MSAINFNLPGDYPHETQPLPPPPPRSSIQPLRQLHLLWSHGWLRALCVHFSHFCVSVLASNVALSICICSRVLSNRFTARAISNARLDCCSSKCKSALRCSRSRGYYTTADASRFKIRFCKRECVDASAAKTCVRWRYF